jgi:hypothetical protein
MKTTMSNTAKEVKAEYQREYRKTMSEAARQKANEYLRRWRLKNRDKLRQYNIDYWECKANQVETIESRVIRLHELGMSLREIGREVGLSHMKVKRLLQMCYSRNEKKG